jgi:alanine dehydrogenase
MTRVGVVREVKGGEKRVALTPADAHALVSDGHAVLVESGAGVGDIVFGAVAKGQAGESTEALVGGGRLTMDDEEEDQER